MQEYDALGTHYTFKFSADRTKPLARLACSASILIHPNEDLRGVVAMMNNQ